MSPSKSISSSTAGVLEVNPFFTDNALEKNAPSEKNRLSCYRYGFQGQEKDDEIKGSGNSVNYKFRMHDPRLGRFFAVDPIANKFPHNSPYAFSENRVIDRIELEGLEVAFIQLDARVQLQTSYIAVTSSYTIGLAVHVNGQYLVFQTPTLGIGEGQGIAVGASIGIYPTGNTSNMLKWGMNWGASTAAGGKGLSGEINYSFENGGDDPGKLGGFRQFYGFGILNGLYVEGSYGFKLHDGSVGNIDYGYFQETFGLSEDMTNELFETLSFELQELSNPIPESAPEPVKKAAEAIPTSVGEIINSAIRDFFPDVGQSDNAEPTDDR